MSSLKHIAANLRQATPLAVALLFLSLGLDACGGDEAGGGRAGLASDSQGGSPSAAQVREQQAEADAEVRERNERVRKQYRERQQATAPTEEELEAKQSVTEFYEIVGAQESGPDRSDIDSEAFCELMSEAAITETIDYARQASGEARQWDCEAAIDVIVRISKRSGGLEQARKAKVIGVNAEGERATASVRFGKGPITSIALVKEDGEWKLAASPAGGG